MKKSILVTALLTAAFSVTPVFAQEPRRERPRYGAGRANATNSTDTADGSSATDDSTAQQTTHTAEPRRRQQPKHHQTTPDKDKKKDEKKDDPDNPKNDRLFMVVANYATVEHPKVITPLTAKEKFKIGAEDAFDTYSVPLAAVLAAISQAKNDDASWGQGWGAYGKRLAAGYGDTVIGSFMTTGVFPSLLHEDPRYFRMGTGTKKARSLYALKRIVVIRNDRGGTEFNFSEFGGNATAAGISLTYHSRADLNVSNWASGFGTQIAIDVVANQCKEFWPDIRQKLFKK